MKWFDIIIKLGPAAFIFMEYLESFLLSFVLSDKTLDSYKMISEPRIDTFDFIIVGAGSAGCQLANRLSEKYTVLLLDAGGEPSPFLGIPIYAYLLNNMRPVDFAHRTVPQKHAAWGLNNHVSHWPAGKVLGGSSSINGLIYIRGNVQGFDAVAEKTGDKRWSMDNVLKYYNKVENYDGWFDREMHGSFGGMGVERGFTMPVTNHLLKAGVELGYRIRDPNNGPYTEGFAPIEFYLKNGRRSDAYHSVLRNAMRSRPNLVVHKYAYVTKVLFKDNVAYGVRYERHGKMFHTSARKEVILSAGAIQTSRILMISGIGPEEHLREIGIQPLVNLPVGQSLQDKYGAMMGPFIVKDEYSFVRDRDITLAAILEWLGSGTGVVSGGRTEMTYSIITNQSRSRGKTDSPDIHIYAVAASTDSRTKLDFEKAFNYNPKSLQYFELARGKDSFLQLVTLKRPKGLGFIKLRDKNPYSALIIDPKYFEEREDMDAMIEGIKFAVKVVEETQAMKEIDGHLMKAPYPGCEPYPFKSDQYYECVARHSTITAYKYCGTAPIGRDIDEPGAVVDSHLRVFGVQNLRLVDASVLQLKYMSSNDVTIRMLGELGSDIILSDWD